MDEEKVSGEKDHRGAIVDALLLVGLVAATTVSVEVGAGNPAARAAGIAVVLGIGFAKAAAVGVRYMRLGRAPRLLLVAFLGWTAIFAVLTITLSIQ